MLQQERVYAKRDALIKSLKPQQAVQRVTTAIEDLVGYVSGEETLEFASGAYASVSHAPRFDIFMAQSDVHGRQLALSFIAAMKLLTFDLDGKMRKAGLKPWNEIGFARVSGMDSPLFQSIGWQKEADRYLEHIWTAYLSANADKTNILFGDPSPGSWINQHSNPYLVQKAAWFTTMTTVDPTLWRQYGYDPDAESLGPYLRLAQVWDDSDPAKVRNALQAVRDMNLGSTFIKDEPKGRRVYIVDEFLLLDDYDIRSVNMRRIAKGLAPVEVESYLPDPLPNAVLPFVQDDIFWPIYLKMCAELGAAPIRPESPLQVRLEPETLRLQVVDPGSMR
ncbi:hypothetical protein [Paracoccus zhejiangensis]|uniref:Uncharacterized protein n=1 Tax=Paracoccus zhejiangensis TaxID=1077935 RepID=A0A2H5F126_9RHOB|nr:hypothetical protein [Paracoccus zhejiangensis]AUH65255.1 hypothetical protein CX676_14685 [Paracoccus zhejiangensis]